MSSKHLPVAPNRQCTSQCLFEEVSLIIVLLLHPFRPPKCQAGLPQQKSPEKASRFIQAACLKETSYYWSLTDVSPGETADYRFVSSPFGMTVISSASTFRSPDSVVAHLQTKKCGVPHDDPRYWYTFDTVINVTNRQPKSHLKKISSLEEFFGTVRTSDLSLKVHFYIFFSPCNFRVISAEMSSWCFGETPCICGGLWKP